jgi:hypothetical protein
VILDDAGLIFLGQQLIEMLVRHRPGPLGVRPLALIQE